jgi:hypothetical protein
MEEVAKKSSKRQLQGFEVRNNPKLSTGEQQ